MKRSWSTYGFIFLLVVVTSSFITCQCGEDVREHAAQVASRPGDCCQPTDGEKALTHPEKDCCGQCFSSSAMSVYVHRAIYNVSATDVLGASLVASQSEQIKPYELHATVTEEGGSFFLSYVFKTSYSSQAPPLG